MPDSNYLVGWQSRCCCKAARATDCWRGETRRDLSGQNTVTLYIWFYFTWHPLHFIFYSSTLRLIIFSTTVYYTRTFERRPNWHSSRLVSFFPQINICGFQVWLLPSHLSRGKQIPGNNIASTSKKQQHLQFPLFCCFCEPRKPAFCMYAISQPCLRNPKPMSGGTLPIVVVGVGEIQFTTKNP